MWTRESHVCDEGENMKRPLGKIAAAFFVLVLATSAATPAHAQTFKVLYNFKAAPDGANPIADLIMDAAGKLYGTSFAGGAPSRGTWSKPAASDNKTVLHNFPSAPGDGSYPIAALIRDAAGNRYGTTYAGGSLACTALPGFAGCGTVFRLDASGNETVLYSFAGGNDGAGPEAPLIMDTAGNLYGTSPLSGAFWQRNVVKIEPSCPENVVHTLTRNGGAQPFSRLLIGPPGH